MAKIGDVCASKIDTLSAAYNGKIDYIDISVVDNREKKITQTAIVLAKDAPSRAKQLVEHGDVIVSLVRPNLNAVAIIEEQSQNLQVASTGYCVLRCNQMIYNRYLFYFCQSETFVNSMTAQATGASYPAVSNSIVKNCEIPLPERNKQKEIADILDKVTGLISLRKQQLAKLDELVKARFVEMFGDFEFNPKEFPVYHLCELCDVGSSKRIYQEEQSISGIPFLKVADLNELIDTGKYSCSTFIPLERYEQLLHKELTPTENDILITSRGTLGKCYIVQSDDEFYFQDGMISWLSNFSPKVSSIYISYLFAQPYIQKQIESLQAGSTVAYLSIAMLKKINVILPPKKLQDDFATFVEHVDQQKQTVQQSLEKLELMKKALMQEYFG